MACTFSRSYLDLFRRFHKALHKELKYLSNTLYTYKSMQNIQRGITPKPNKFCRSQLQICLANSPQVLDLSFFYEKLVREDLNWGEIVWCRKVEYRMSRQWDFLCWIPDHQLISLGQQVSALYFFQFKEFVINKYHMFLYTTLK